MKYRVFFSNPSENPPEPLPRVLCESEDKEACLKVLAIAKQFSIGYALGVQPIVISVPRKRSQETLAKSRKTRMVNKINSKYSLFADEFTERELKERPQYFAGERPETIFVEVRRKMEPITVLERTPDEAIAMLQAIGIPAVNPELEALKEKRRRLLEIWPSLQEALKRRQQAEQERQAAYNRYLMSEQSLPLWNAQ